MYGLWGIGLQNEKVANLDFVYTKMLYNAGPAPRVYIYIAYHENDEKLKHKN